MELEWIIIRLGRKSEGGRVRVGRDDGLIGRNDRGGGRTASDGTPLLWMWMKDKIMSPPINKREWGLASCFRE